MDEDKQEQSSSSSSSQQHEQSPPQQLPPSPLSRSQLQLLQNEFMNMGMTRTRPKSQIRRFSSDDVLQPELVKIDERQLFNLIINWG